MFRFASIVAAGLVFLATPAPADPPPSWNAGPAKEAIVAFVDSVTTPGPDYVVPEERIAVFDNDGTL